MEATENRIAPQLRRLLGTRSGTLILAAAAAVIAGIILIAYLNHYRSSVEGGTASETALVARGLIPKGTSGDVVVSETLFDQTKKAGDEIVEGAIGSTAAIAGKVAVRDIYPGEQLTAQDFAAGADPIRGRLSGYDRAVSVPVDATHGLIGNVRRGDRVDVLAGFNASKAGGASRPIVRTLLQNVLVLGVPGAGGGISSGDSAGVMLRVTDDQAAKLAFASDNGRIWLTLRSPAGSSQAQRPPAADLDGVLSNTAPVTGASR